MTRDELLAGRWFRAKITNYAPKYPKLYRYKPTSGLKTNPGYLVELPHMSDQTQYHCDVYSIEDDGTLKVYTFLLGEMVERTLQLSAFEVVDPRDVPVGDLKILKNSL